MFQGLRSASLWKHNYFRQICIFHSPPFKYNSVAQRNLVRSNDLNLNCVNYMYQNRLLHSNSDSNVNLAKLKILEVTALLRALNIVSISSKQDSTHILDGEMMSLLETNDELKEVGVNIPTLKFKVLLKHVAQFKLSGVPTSLLSTAEVCTAKSNVMQVNATSLPIADNLGAQLSNTSSVPFVSEASTAVAALELLTTGQHYTHDHIFLALQNVSSLVKGSSELQSQLGQAGACDTILRCLRLYTSELDPNIAHPAAEEEDEVHNMLFDVYVNNDYSALMDSGGGNRPHHLHLHLHMQEQQEVEVDEEDCYDRSELKKSPPSVITSNTSSNVRGVNAETARTISRVVECLNVVTLLCRHSEEDRASTSKENVERLIELGCVEDVVKVSRHPHLMSGDSNVVIAASNVIKCLAVGPDFTVFKESGVWNTLVAQLDNTLIREGNDGVVVVSILDALTNLTSTQEQVEFYHTQDIQNNVNTFIEVLSRYGAVPAVTNAFLWCFRNLSAVYCESYHLLFPTLVNIAVKHKHDKDIVMLLCQCVSNLCIYSENRVVLGEHNMCEQLVELYVLHCTKESIAYNNNKCTKNEVNSSVTDEVDEEVLVLSDAIMSAMRDLCEECEQNRLKMNELLNELV